MSLGLSAKSINGFVVPSRDLAVRNIPIGLPVLCGAALFLAAMAATLAIGFRDPRVEYAYECIVFMLGACCCLRVSPGAMKLFPSLPLAMILIWGFCQLAVGATVYRHATLEGSLHSAALAATAWISWSAFRSDRLRMEVLSALAWFGALIAVISVLAYFTSPGKILWMFEAPYPDIWGPFLSRNNFAQFLELAMPAALWFGLRESGRTLFIFFGAIMLAAGLASASRAGFVILSIEAIGVVWIHRNSGTRRMAVALVLATILFALIPGVDNLIGRLQAPDPFQGRKEIAHSTLAMIAEKPWAGFGLGTFPTVYPAYAVFDTGQSVEHAHNDWLEWASEGGIPYALLWFALAMWSVRPALHHAWGIGVLGSFLHSLVDYPFARFGISAWTLILLGMLAATDLRKDRRNGH